MGGGRSLGADADLRARSEGIALDGLDTESDIERWRSLSEQIHSEVCEKGIDPDRGCFTQFYGSTQVDASLLMLVLVGFLPPDDPRIIATVEAIEADLLVDGFVLRYRTDVAPDGSPLADDGSASVDGLPPVRAPSCSPRSGWSTTSSCSVGLTTPAGGSRPCWPCATTSGCCRRNGTSSTGGCVGNFPQAFLARRPAQLRGQPLEGGRGAGRPSSRRPEAGHANRPSRCADRPLNRLPNPRIDRERPVIRVA